MVVRQGLELSGADLADPQSDSDEETDFESLYSGPSPRRRAKGCLQLVQQMMDRFMVRGSHGPMQWMLDLHSIVVPRDSIAVVQATRGHGR